MKFDFTKLSVKDVNGNPVPHPDKQIGEAIYLLSNEIELGDAGRDIYEGKEVELSQLQVEEVKRILEDQRVQMMPFFKRAVIAFINKA